MSAMLIVAVLAYCVGRWHGHRIAMRFLRGPTAARILSRLAHSGQGAAT